MAEIVIKLVNGDLAGKTAQELRKEYAAAELAVKKAAIGTKEWIDATQRLDQSKKLLADYKDQLASTGAASDKIKAAFNNLPGAQYFNKVTESFGMMKSGVGGLVSQFGVLKTAIAATGIGLLVVAVATLVGWFQKTDEGATLLSGIMRGLGVVMDMVFGKLIDVFNNLKGFFTGDKSIKQGLQDLVDWMYNNLVNRIKAFMVIWEGITNLDWKKTADGLIQMTTGVENATDKMMAFGKEVANAVQEGIELEKQLDAIEDRARELSVRNAETEKEVSRLVLQSKKVSLTYQERIDLLDEASAKELKNHQLQVENARAMEAFRQKEIDLNKKRNIQNDELDQALVDAQIKRINLEKDSITLQEKIENRRAALIEKQQAELQKEEDARIKARQAAWDEYYKNLHDLEDEQVAAMADSREKDLAQLKVSLQHQIEALDTNAPFYGERLAAAQVLARMKKKEIDDKWNKKEEDDLKARLKKEIDAIEESANHETTMLMMQLVNHEITRKQFNQLSLETKKKAWNAELDLLEKNGQKETQQYEAIAQKVLDIELKKQDKIRQYQQQAFNAGIQLGQAFLQAQIDNIDRENAAGQNRLAEIEKRQGKESEAYKVAQHELLKTQKENFEHKKQLEKSQIKINALAEIAAEIKSAVEIGGIYGVVVGAALAAATLIRANDAIQQVNAQTFALGGIPDGVLRGPSHAQGGIPIIAEGNEIILTKGVYQNPDLRSLASAINVAGGGRSFAVGGPVNPFNSGRSSSASSSPSSPAGNSNGGSLEGYLIKNFEEIKRWQASLRVINYATSPDNSGSQDQLDVWNRIKDAADV